jgi:4-amino-4-deoxy-L-arabinose transferase-like glycosyltransferase
MGTEPLRASRSERWTIGSITAAFLLLLTVWALATPLFQAPDELPHADAAIQLAEGHGWPAPGTLLATNAIESAKTSAAGTPPADRQTWAALQAAHPGLSAGVNQMTQHPPTYYALAAGVLHLMHFEDLRWDVVLIVLRLLDVLLVAPLPLLVWASARRLTRSPRFAAVAAIAVFAVPQLAQIGSSITNDAPVILLGGIVTWLVVRVLTGDRSWATTLGTGLALGALVATKATGFPAIPFVALGLLVPTVAGLTLPARVLRTVVALAIGAAASGWWWIRNVVVFHALQPNGLARTWTPSPGTGRDPGYFLGSEWDSLTVSFWGKFGLLAYPIDPALAIGLTVIGGALVLVAVLARSRFRLASAVLLVFPLVSLLLLLVNNWESYERLHRLTGSQGRYFYVALGALVLVAAFGAVRFLPPLGRRIGGRVVTVGSAAMAVYGLVVAFVGFYVTAAGLSGRTALHTGLAHLRYTTPLGGATLEAVGALFVIVGAIAVVRTWRACGQRPPDRLSGDHPTTP